MEQDVQEKSQQLVTITYVALALPMTRKLPVFAC